MKTPALKPVWGKYCGYCGAKNKGADFPKSCGNGHVTFASPVVVGIALQPVTDGAQAWLLAVRRNIRPCKGELALPGGYTDNGETPGKTARRELAEETGIHHPPHSAAFFAQTSVAPFADTADPRHHILLFYSLPPVDARDIDPAFSNAETQELELVRFDPARGMLADRRGDPTTLCFPTHQAAAVRFLLQQNQPPRPKSGLGSVLIN